MAFLNYGYGKNLVSIDLISPLSMYLSNKNIKLASLPMANEVESPKEIFNIPAKNIIGFTNYQEKLNEVMEERVNDLILLSSSSYESLEEYWISWIIKIKL